MGRRGHAQIAWAKLRARLQHYSKVKGEPAVEKLSAQAAQKDSKLGAASSMAEAYASVRCASRTIATKHVI